MKRKAVLGIVVTMLLASMSMSVFNVHSIWTDKRNGEKDVFLGAMKQTLPLSVQWSRALQPVVTRMVFGSSPAIADLGPDINRVGGEPDRDLEIVFGSDEYRNFYPELGGSLAYGIWRAVDSRGNLEWARSTGTDEARSSPALADVNNDGFLDIVGGTTSGLNVEVMDRFGNFLWTFPSPPCRNWQLGVGDGMWHSSPAIANVYANEETRIGETYFFTSRPLEVAIGNNPYGNVWVFDGDNSDGVDEGITSPWWGVEGKDWDVLSKFQTGGRVISTPAVGNIDGVSLLGDINEDGVIDFVDANLLIQALGREGAPGWIPEDLAKDGVVDMWDLIVFAGNFGNSDVDVVIGSLDGNVYAINGYGQAKWMLSTQGPVYGSPGLADFDSDGDLEIVIGSTDGRVYFINGDENRNGIIDAGEATSFLTGGPVFCSPAIGDVDGDGDLEAIIGSTDSKVYSFDYNPTLNTVALNWATSTAGPIYSSPALADRNNVYQYDKDWPMFRNNPSRTGYHGQTLLGQTLDTYIGSDDGYLYLINGATGGIIDRFGTNGRIRTSPSVADIDGDYKLEILFYDQGADSGGVDTFWALEDAGDPGGIADPSPVHDVAVVGVTASATSVSQGEIVSINVSVKNKGDFSENFSVATYYDANTIGTQAVSLAAGASANLTFNWNTASVPVGAYVLKARATTVPFEIYTADNGCIDGTVMVYRIGSHDIAVTNITASPSSVTEGGTVTIEVRVLNNGTVQETSSVFAYADLAVVGTQTLTLTAGESRTLTFNWNTAGCLGDYAMAATAEAVLGETDTNNNAFIDGAVTVAPTAQRHNIAITNVFLSSPTVHPGEIVYINAIVANEGTQTEIFNVTAYVNDTSLSTISAMVNARNSQLLTFKWNTTYWPVGNCIISAVATLVPNETNTADNTFIDGILTVGIDFHDIALNYIRPPSKTIVVQNFNCTLNSYVDVTNQGDCTETFNVTVHANTTIIAEFTSITLASGNSGTLFITWNTAGFAHGNYTIWAYAWPVQNETDTADNTLVDGRIAVTILGDVNGDFTVDIFDAIILSSAYGSTPTSANWSRNADINDDNTVDIFDAILLAGNYGQTII